MSSLATIASNAQFADVKQMNAWYDQVMTNARERRLDRVRSGDGPRACAGLGVGERRLVGAEVPWSIDGGEGRLLCFTNESDQNALFWTNTATAVGSIAVSPAADSRLEELVTEWARSPYRVAD